jgi:hypothetical protein
MQVLKKNDCSESMNCILTYYQNPSTCTVTTVLMVLWLTYQHHHPMHFVCSQWGLTFTSGWNQCELGNYVIKYCAKPLGGSKVTTGQRGLSYGSHLSEAK